MYLVFVVGYLTLLITLLYRSNSLIGPLASSSHRAGLEKALVGPHHCRREYVRPFCQLPVFTATRTITYSLGDVLIVQRVHNLVGDAALDRPNIGFDRPQDRNRVS